jgi:ornithine carbamoyltransferase
VINALTDTFHPLQALADIQTLCEVFSPKLASKEFRIPSIQIAWIGDANNILNSLLVSCPRLGFRLSVATPLGYEPPADIVRFANASGTVHWYNDPLKALKNADVIITDTWVSMGMEKEKARRLEDFRGFRARFFKLFFGKKKVLKKIDYY